MRKLENDQFLSLIRDDILVHGNYVNGRTSIKVSCMICGHVWSPIARSLIQGHGCPECGKITAKETEKWHIDQNHFLNKIHKNIKEEITVIGNYVSCREPVQVRCLRCERSWKSKPIYLYKGYGCDYCFRKAKGIASRKSHSEFLEKVNKEHNESIEVIGQYTTGKQRIDVKCLQCGWTWKPIARCLYRRGCPRCSFSKGERKIQFILTENLIKHECQYTFSDLISPDGGKFRFDFAIMDDSKISYLVEYDGLHHYKPIKYMGGLQRFLTQKRNDYLKNKYCEDNKIRLVRISYKFYNKLSLEMLL